MLGCRLVRFGIWFAVAHPPRVVPVVDERWGGLDEITASVRVRIERYR
jgi:hypothetical protein